MILPNQRVQDIVDDISKEQLAWQEQGYKHICDVNYTEFAQQIVGETITAILATDQRDEIYTQFDQDRIAAATSKIIDNIRNHWNFK